MNAGSVRALASAGAFTDLPMRIASAGVMLPVALAALVLGGGWWAGLLGVLGLLVAFEWCRLWRRSARRESGIASVWMVAGTLYLVAAILDLFVLRMNPKIGLGNVTFLLAMIWASDIGAYAAGRICGGPLLAPRISPGKTWSGAAGGVVAALIAATAFAAFGHGRVWWAETVAAALVIVGQAGDLVESAVKRRAGVKDSSRLIPGHGGVLDRLDSLLAAAPVAALIAQLQWRGLFLWQ